MRKLILVAISFLLATSAYALNETNQGGPQHITTCYITGAGPITSGDVVILQTSSPTYWGAEVTGTNTAGLPIHGVVVDSRNYTAEEVADGEWVNVQLFGYCSLVKISWTSGSVTANAAGSMMVTGSDRFTATSSNELGTTTTSAVSGNTTYALESKKGTRTIRTGTLGPIVAGSTAKVWLGW